MSYSSKQIQTNLFLNLCRNRYRVWIASSLAVILSLSGLIVSWINPSIGYPLRPGLDFTGGTQIKVERVCFNQCNEISSSDIGTFLKNNSLATKKLFNDVNLTSARVQSLDSSKTLVIRLPFLSAAQSEEVLKSLASYVGPFEPGSQSIDTIGPSLGSRLLRSSLISLLVAFSGIALYISYRFDRQFSLLAIIALLHDLIIVSGVFAWLGVLIGLEVNSLFAVALLTIAGYSVNDTVVVFDRIREISKLEPSLSFNQMIDVAVSATLSRTLYTSGTTLLPLLSLIFFGGDTLYWFAIALGIGVIVGSWSSIALAPSLLSLKRN